MIEVLHFIDTYRIGGPGKTIINSALHIDRRRFRVQVASFTSIRSEPSEFAAAVRSAGIPHLALPETRRFNVSHVATLRNFVRASGIHVLHMHGYRTDVLGYVATRGLAVALVTTHHGWIRNNWTQSIYARMALRVCSQFHGVQLVSERLRGELPVSIRHRPEIAVIRNGIILEDYQPTGRRDEVRSSLGVGPDAVLLGTIGRLSIEKGCLEMLEAFAIVAGRTPQAHLAFIGEGPLKTLLLERISARGLTARVHLVPHQRDVRTFYEAVDVIVSPSRTEGLSNVILESLTARRPIVVTRVGGNAEIVTDGVSALMVDPQRPELLADAVLRIVEDPSLAQRLVEAGAARVREFAFDTRMRREERFYEESLGRLT